MTDEGLLQGIICMLDAIYHGKSYRFRNQDGTWYSREACRNINNYELWNELMPELRYIQNAVEYYENTEDRVNE